MRLVIAGILTLLILIMTPVLKREAEISEENRPVRVCGFVKATDILLKIFPEELYPWLRFHEQVNIPLLRK